MAQQGAEQHAIVLTGNGTNAAYEVGVLEALLGGGARGDAPIKPYCFSGTSMGAFNAAVMVSTGGASARPLREIWLNEIAVGSARSANGIFRMRAEPTQYVDQMMKGDLETPLRSMVELTGDLLFFARETSERMLIAMTESGTLADRAARMTELNQWIDVRPLASLLNSSIDPEKIRNSRIRLAVTALDWRTGQPHTFRNRELGSPRGRDPILAAVAMPGVVPPPRVEGRFYVDAGVLMDTPLKPAIRERDPNGGPVVLHVVYVDAAVADLPTPPVSNTFTTVYRLLMLALSRLVTIDLARAQDINRQLFMKNVLEDAVAVTRGSAAAADENSFTSVLGMEAGSAWEAFTTHTSGKVPVTIHKYRPVRNVLGFDLAAFERCNILALMEDGREDALSHDCDANGCIKPS